MKKNKKSFVIIQELLVFPFSSHFEILDMCVYSSKNSKEKKRNFTFVNVLLQWVKKDTIVQWGITGYVCASGGKCEVNQASWSFNKILFPINKH